MHLQFSDFKSEIRTAYDFWFWDHSVDGYMLPVVHYHVINFFLEFAKSRTTEIQRKYLVGLNPVHSQGSSSKQKLLKFSNNKINQLQSSELATIKIVNTQKSLWRISTACLNTQLLDLNQITLSLRHLQGCVKYLRTIS